MNTQQPRQYTWVIRNFIAQITYMYKCMYVCSYISNYRHQMFVNKLVFFWKRQSIKFNWNLIDGICYDVVKEIKKKKQINENYQKKKKKIAKAKSYYTKTKTCQRSLLSFNLPQFPSFLSMKTKIGTKKWFSQLLRLIYTLHYNN